MTCVLAWLIGIYRRALSFLARQLLPWSAQVAVGNMTESEASDLLYAIGQESLIAFKKMPVLCALCGVSYPPQLDTTKSGSSSVPLNAATPPKDS
jgi:hypothetical protein